MQKIIHAAQLLAIVAVITIAASCSGARGSDNTITVSILPQKYFVDVLSDSALKVNVMVPPGASHSTYSPTTRQFKDLSDSRLYIGIGHLGYETAWLDRLGELNKDMKLLNLSDYTELIAGDCDHDHEGEDEHAHGIDPHIWLSPKVITELLPLMRDALIESYPELKATIEANYSKLMAQIEETDAAMQATCENLSYRSFMIFHPALTYLARDYGLEQKVIEVDGKEPSPAYLASLIESARQDSIRVIFIQQEYDVRNARTIAKEAGIELVVIDPMKYDWVENIKELNNIFQKYLNE